MHAFLTEMYAEWTVNVQRSVRGLASLVYAKVMLHSTKHYLRSLSQFPLVLLLSLPGLGLRLRAHNATAP